MNQTVSAETHTPAIPQQDTAGDVADRTQPDPDSGWWGPLTHLTPKLPSLPTVTLNLTTVDPRRLTYTQPLDFVHRLLPAAAHSNDNSSSEPTHVDTPACQPLTEGGWDKQQLRDITLPPGDCPGTTSFLTTSHPDFSHTQWAHHVEEHSGGKVTGAAFVTTSSGNRHPVARVHGSDGRNTWWCACITEKQHPVCATHPCPGALHFAHSTDLNTQQC